MTTKPTVHGEPCDRCGGTLRYAGNKNCVRCRREAANIAAGRDGRVTKPVLGRDWPTVKTKAGDIVPEDPFIVMDREGIRQEGRYT